MAAFGYLQGELRAPMNLYFSGACPDQENLDHGIGYSMSDLPINENPSRQGDHFR